MLWADARFESIHHDQQLHQVVTGGGAGGLHHKHIAGATFCLISTVTSPSEKRPTSAAPKDAPRCLAISSAMLRLALPVKTTNSELLDCMSFPRSGLLERMKIFGRGGRTRTLACRNQNPGPVTNLATPLHWSIVIDNNEPVAFYSGIQCSKGCFSRLLQSLICQLLDAACKSKSLHFCANTALPEPVIIARIPCELSQCLAFITSGQSASATGCKSLWPKP